MAEEQSKTNFILVIALNILYLFFLCIFLSIVPLPCKILLWCILCHTENQFLCRIVISLNPFSDVFDILQSLFLISSHFFHSNWGKDIKDLKFSCVCFWKFNRVKIYFKNLANFSIFFSNVKIQILIF